MSKQYEKGSFGEDKAAEFLIRNGYKIIRRNYRVKGGEIDIIARKGDTLAFVEVKTREEGSLISGEEAVNLQKRRLIIKTAQRFMSEYEDEADGRFDVCSIVTKGDTIVSLKYYVSAFDASEN